MKRKILASAILLIGTATELLAGARFGSMQGTVQVFEKGKWVKATIATKITNGMGVETGPKSSAVIIFSRGGQMALKSHTRIMIGDEPGTGGGTDRQMIMAHGDVSGFVKKNIQSPNAYRMRTPTVIAGVRGSLLTARLRGNTFVATAQKSAAYIQPAPKAIASDNQTKALQSAIAMRGRIAGQADDAKTIIARSAAAPAAEKVGDAKKQVKEIQTQKAAVLKEQTKLNKDTRSQGYSAS